MARRPIPLAAAAILAISLAGMAPASAQEFVLPFVTVNAAPEGAEVAPGEHLEAAEFDSIRPLSQGPVGPLPVFFADDEFGCQWSTAVSSGVIEWIALAQRGGPEPCNFFQTKFTAAAAAGAEALIVINNGPGPVSGLAVGPIPGVGVDQIEGGRLRDSLDTEDPEAVKVTLELLDPDTLLPPGSITPTKVSSVQASSGADGVSVTGQAAFGGEHPFVVGEDPEGDPPVHPDLARFGLDATEIAIHQPDPHVGEIQFVIRVTDLRAPPPPEFVRYLWQFRVAGEEFWVQAKTSDVSTATAFADDPVGTAQNIPGSFRLRGDCGTVGVVATCVHLAWLDGTFDTAGDKVTIRVPLDLDVAPEITAGATIEPEDGMTASIQAVVSNSTTSDSVFQEVGYTTAEKTVEVGIVPAGAEPAFTQQADLGAGDSFSANLDSAGLEPGEYDVHVRACFGDNCGTASTAIVL